MPIATTKIISKISQKSKPCASQSHHPLISSSNHGLLRLFIYTPPTPIPPSFRSNQNQNKVNNNSQIQEMCRGFRENETQPLRIRAFYTQLSVSCAKNKTQLPDFLTLHYLPRINGTLLEINGSRIRPDSPAFVTLHRVFSEEIRRGLSYGSRERVAVREGARFEIYAGDVKVLKGIFRKDEGENWKIDCKCMLSADDVVDGVRDAEVSVEAEGAAGLMSQKVAMVPAVRRRWGRCCELEEIPEEREGELGSDACGCCDCGGEEETDGGDCEMEMEMEGVRWALDVGIWVACIGVGLLVSRASYSKRLRRKRFI